MQIVIENGRLFYDARAILLQYQSSLIHQRQCPRSEVSYKKRMTAQRPPAAMRGKMPSHDGIFGRCGTEP